MTIKTHLFLVLLSHLPFLLRGQHDSILMHRVSSITCSNPDALGRGYLGTIGFGASVQSTTRLNDKPWGPDGSAIITVGLGNPEKFIGIDVRMNIYGVSNDVGRPNNFGESTFDLHLSRMLNPNLWVGIGGYDLLGINTFDPNNLHSYYACLTQTVAFKKQNSSFLSTLWLTAGVGNGRFRLDKDYTLAQSSPFNVFASVAVQIMREGNFTVEWSGYGLYSGVSLFPFKKLPIQINIGGDDLFNHQRRVVLAGCLGFHLKKKGKYAQFKHLFLPAPPPPQSSRV